MRGEGVIKGKHAYVGKSRLSFTYFIVETHSLSQSDCYAAIYALQWLLRLLVELRKRAGKQEVTRVLHFCMTSIYY